MHSLCYADLQSGICRHLISFRYIYFFKKSNWVESIIDTKTYAFLLDFAEYFTMGKLHKDIAVYIVQSAEDSSKSEQQTIKVRQQIIETHTRKSKSRTFHASNAF